MRPTSESRVPSMGSIIPQTDDLQTLKKKLNSANKVICNWVSLLYAKPVTVAVRSEARVLAGWLLGSWVRIPLKAWMFLPCLSVLYCPV
jgi:hypothetical protein